MIMFLTKKKGGANGNSNLSMGFICLNPFFKVWKRDKKGTLTDSHCSIPSQAETQSSNNSHHLYSLP